MNKRSKFTKLVNEKKWLRVLLGMLVGALLGIIYWEFIGCNGGNCPLTSNPYKTVVVFAAMGGFLAYDKKEKNKITEIEN